MNVFFIPSWYSPSLDAPTGIFFMDQAKGLVKYYDEIQIGISAWGQNDERFLLRGYEVLQVPQKLLKYHRLESSKITICDRLVEYFQPAFTWTWKIRKGNIRGIIHANRLNFKQFESDFGTVDLIHAHVAYPSGNIAMAISTKYNIPYILSEQMSPFPFKYFQKRDGSLADRIRIPYEKSYTNIAVSNALANKMRAAGVPNVRTIYNPVDEQFFTFERKEKTAPFRFFTLGRMVPQKGIDVLLYAILKMGLRHDLQFTIGGDGAELKNYQQLAEKLGIAHLITWTGMLDRSQSLDQFTQCHAFVLPSRHESMGVVFAEAIACGRPVIGTVCGGPEEIINETNGYLVPPEDPDALAQAMIRMIENYHDFDQAAIRADFENRFSSRVITRLIVDLYEEVVDEHRKTATNQKM